MHWRNISRKVRMIRMKKKFLLCLSIVCFLGACTGSASLDLPATIEPTSKTTRTSTPDKLVGAGPVEARILYAGDQFARGSYPLLWWSPDSKRVFFRDSTTIWEYSVDSGFKKPLQELDQRTITPLAVFTHSPEAEAVTTSPSGHRAVFLIPVKSNMPTSTPIPLTPVEDRGEGMWEQMGLAEVWYWDSDSMVKLGEIENCVQDYLWSRDENVVVARAIPVPAPCRETHAWLIDLRSLRIVSLFPKDTFGQLVTVLGISPNSRYLLYYFEDKAHIRDLESHDDMVLNIPSEAAVRWVDNSHLLVSYKEDRRSVLGIYPIESQIVVPFFRFEDFVSIRDMLPVIQEVSPNGEWLALAMGHNHYYVEAIWLIRIPKQCTG